MIVEAVAGTGESGSQLKVAQVTRAVFVIKLETVLKEDRRDKN